jgi:hypothetical protein
MMERQGDLHRLCAVVITTDANTHVLDGQKKDISRVLSRMVHWDFVVEKVVKLADMNLLHELYLYFRLNVKIKISK